MLGFIRAAGRGDDALLADLARRLQAQGLRLSGAVQHNQAGPHSPCLHMDLRLLSPDHAGDPVIRISQMRGVEARGCRLDSDGLERAVGLIAADLARASASRDLVVLNKFGKHEAEGGGLRPVIAQAIEADLPVIIKVSAEAVPAFLDFVGDLAQELPHDGQSLFDWCLAQVAARGG
ncbi:DUF2478 domain-containing protein [Paracoccus sp. p4-l81]|uniref:DUF2478 domain-containing protein n=1 Tax=Paracoccus sp. p4-l81 TaxID=3342806 RepID=UPI0035B9F319